VALFSLTPFGGSSSSSLNPPPLLLCDRFSQLTFGQNLYMPQRVFADLLMRYCQENAIARPKFTPTSYEGPFSIMNLKMTGPMVQKYPNTKDDKGNPTGKDMSGRWIRGCDVPTAVNLSIATRDHVERAERMQAAVIGIFLLCSMLWFNLFVQMQPRIRIRWFRESDAQQKSLSWQWQHKTLQNH
jgi:hypothetical protein